MWGQCLIKETISIKRNIQIIKRNQIEILELKSGITEMKNSLKGLNYIFELSEERINKLRDKLIGIIQSEFQKEKQIKKTERSLRQMWNTI